MTDESGGVLPGVSVTVIQTDTGFTRTTVTDESGGYVLPNLPLGPYRLEVMLAGFRTYAQTGIVLQVGATPAINVALALGQLAETVTVEAAAPLVDTQSAGIGEVVEQERIVELPLQGRQVTDLIFSVGAAVDMGRPNNRSFQGGVNIAVAGGLSFGVSYLLDGALHNDPQNAAGLALPFPDAVQEFRVTTSGTERGERRTVGRLGERRDEVGYQPVLRQRLRVLPRCAVQLDQPLCADRPRRQEEGRRSDAAPVWRHDRRTRHARPVVLLRRVPADRDDAATGTAARARAHGADACRRLHDVRFGGMSGWSRGHVAGALCRQPGQPRHVQPGCAEPRRPAPEDDGSVR